MKSSSLFSELKKILIKSLLAITFFCCLSLSAELKFNRQFSDNMVIQRDKPVVITGLADKGTEIELHFANQKKKATSDKDGIWKIPLEPMAANINPQKMTVFSGANTISIANVLIGDVFLIARQTSIDITLGRDEQGKNAAENYTIKPNLRVIIIKTIPDRFPQKDLAEKATSGWAELNKENALKMTASTFYLANDLAENGEVPIGIIDLNLGSAFVVSWLSRAAQLETEKLYGKSDLPGNIKRMENLAELAAQGKPMPKKEVISSDPVSYALFPAGGYNAVLNPLKGLALKAAIIQLGNDYPYMIYDEIDKSDKPFDKKELNRAYVETYNIRKVGFRMEPVTTPRIPREWRKIIGGEDMPMALIVPPGSNLNTLGQHNREMRELQRQTAGENPNVEIILPGTGNVPFSAQPKDEKLLAERCYKWISGSVYNNKNIIATGPVFDRMETNFNEATIYFKPGTAKGLKAKGDALNFFEAAGLTGEYYPAQAKVEKNTIKIKSDKVNRIARVRYNWNHKPNQELINSADLPCLPFRTEKKPYLWFVRNEEKDLPIEYSTPANEWKKNDVTLINGQLKSHGYDNFTGWVGPVGIKTGPFGPNMGVREVIPGSPADGKIFVGDIIYSANGKMLGEKAWLVMADAVTYSETLEAKGKLILGIRRGSENIDVEITLPVMGSYSSTSPYDCPKTEKIISNLEDWVIKNGADAGFLNSHALFMLATGDPKMQGYLRRIIYKMMKGRDPNKEIIPTNAGKSWFNSADAILFGEYYLATGDKNVLPYLKNSCDRLAATQNPLGGWRHNFPGGATYGLIPNAGLPGVMGMYFAKQAGLDINEKSYELGVKHFGDKRAETGFLIYGFGGCQRDVPPPFDPEVMNSGHMNSYNGGLSAAGILMRFAGKDRAAHLCSFISAFAWNNTFHGHGGNFWNGFWTPLGAFQHGESAFLNFWKNYRWYRELNRMPDGSLIQRASGNSGAGNGVVLVAPRNRIQITKAPKSPFAIDAPKELKPALTAYWAKDYAGCVNLIDDLLKSGNVAKKDKPTVEYLRQQAVDIQESIKLDLARMKKLVAEGKAYEAKTFIDELKGVMKEDDKRLADIVKLIGNPKTVAKIKPKENEKSETPEDKRKWQCLVSELNTDGKSKRGEPAVYIKAEAPAEWKIKIVESLSDAPKGWTAPNFEDSKWKETTLPISWRMYHTALLRTKFKVENKDAFDLLRFRAWLFRQQGIEIYLNGELIGKVNNLEKKTGNVDNKFKASALKLLRNGENTLAVTSRHNWRWGMLFMKVYNDGFDFNLDARLKEEK